MAESLFWALVAAFLLGCLAVAAASLDGALGARGRGAGNLAGGWSAPLAETARLMRQRRRTLVAADVLLWRTGGAALLVAALLKVAVVPVDGWALADLAVGLVWFNAMDVTVWAAVWLTGWGANSAHALIGGYRFLAQGLAYELPLMFALTAPAVAAGSLRLAEVEAAQRGGAWFVLWMPVAFAVYCLGVVAFSVWGPLSVAAGVDLAGGVLAELSGVDRLLVLAGRYALLATGAAFAVPMFLGGADGPLLPGWAWFALKTLLLLAVLVALKRRLPVLRPDRFVEVGWLVLLPAVLLQVLVVSVVAVWRY